MKPSIEEATRRWTAVQPNVAAFISTMVTDLRHREDILQDCAVAVLSSYDRYEPKKTSRWFLTQKPLSHCRLHLRKPEKLNLR